MEYDPKTYMLHDCAPMDETDPVYLAGVALWRARLEAIDRDNGRTPAQKARIVLAAARNLRWGPFVAPAIVACGMISFGIMIIRSERR